MQRLLLTTAIALGTLFALHAPATADPPPPRDISAEIAALRPTIVSARLYAISDTLSFNSTRHEADIAKGCYYGTGDDLGPLLDLLTSSGLKETTPTTNAFEARIVVYLTTHDGTTLPLVLTNETNVPAWGSYEHTIPVTARMGFGPALHAWMAHHTETSPTSASCTPLYDIH